MACASMLRFCVVFLPFSAQAEGVAAAFERLHSRRARGKVVLEVVGDGNAAASKTEPSEQEASE